MFKYFKNLFDRFKDWAWPSEFIIAIKDVESERRSFKKDLARIALLINTENAELQAVSNKHPKSDEDLEFIIAELQKYIRAKLPSASKDEENKVLALHQGTAADVFIEQLAKKDIRFASIGSKDDKISLTIDSNKYTYMIVRKYGIPNAETESFTNIHQLFITLVLSIDIKNQLLKATQTSKIKKVLELPPFIPAGRGKINSTHLEGANPYTPLLSNKKTIENRIELERSRFSPAFGLSPHIAYFSRNKIKPV